MSFSATYSPIRESPPPTGSDPHTFYDHPGSYPHTPSTVSSSLGARLDSGFGMANLSLSSQDIQFLEDVGLAQSIALSNDKPAGRAPLTPEHFSFLVAPSDHLTGRKSASPRLGYDRSSASVDSASALEGIGLGLGVREAPRLSGLSASRWAPESNEGTNRAIAPNAPHLPSIARFSSDYVAPRYSAPGFTPHTPQSDRFSDGDHVNVVSTPNRDAFEIAADLRLDDGFQYVRDSSCQGFSPLQVDNDFLRPLGHQTGPSHPKALTPLRSPRPSSTGPVPSIVGDSHQRSYQESLQQYRNTPLSSFGIPGQNNSFSTQPRQRANTVGDFAQQYEAFSLQDQLSLHQQASQAPFAFQHGQPSGSYPGNEHTIDFDALSSALIKSEGHGRTAQTQNACSNSLTSALNSTVPVSSSSSTFASTPTAIETYEPATLLSGSPTKASASDPSFATKSDLLTQFQAIQHLHPGVFGVHKDYRNGVASDAHYLANLEANVLRMGGQRALNGRGLALEGPIGPLAGLIGTTGLGHGISPIVMDPALQRFLLDHGLPLDGPSPTNKKAKLYKTELCRTWERNPGARTVEERCKYGNKCQYAHGLEEIRPIERHPKYKTQICTTFWLFGQCAYGRRCCFLHKDIPVGGIPELGELGTPAALRNILQARMSLTGQDETEAETDGSESNFQPYFQSSTNNLPQDLHTLAPLGRHPATTFQHQRASTYPTSGSPGLNAYSPYHTQLASNTTEYRSGLLRPRERADSLTVNMPPMPKLTLTPPSVPYSGSDRSSPPHTGNARSYSNGNGGQQQRPGSAYQGQGLRASIHAPSSGSTFSPWAKNEQVGRSDLTSTRDHIW